MPEIRMRTVEKSVDLDPVESESESDSEAESELEPEFEDEVDNEEESGDKMAFVRLVTGAVLTAAGIFLMAW